mmetsp:Transcript_17904/g.43062  ORF Transcript_17904/g.43062 Transcript_17904/m.43062 type:complete len:203 (-) Transcript_17904:457-1065(-)
MICSGPRDWRPRNYPGIPARRWPIPGTAAGMGASTAEEGRTRTRPATIMSRTMKKPPGMEAAPPGALGTGLPSRATTTATKGARATANTVLKRKSVKKMKNGSGKMTIPPPSPSTGARPQRTTPILLTSTPTAYAMTTTTMTTPCPGSARGAARSRRWARHRRWWRHPTPPSKRSTGARERRWRRARRPEANAANIPNKRRI